MADTRDKEEASHSRQGKTAYGDRTCSNGWQLCRQAEVRTPVRRREEMEAMAAPEEREKLT